MYTYKLINSGYEIYHNNKLILKQNKYPNQIELGEMDSRTTEQMAKLVILKLQNRLSPFITLEEENRLRTEELSDTDLANMVNLG